MEKNTRKQYQFSPLHSSLRSLYFAPLSPPTIPPAGLLSPHTINPLQVLAYTHTGKSKSLEGKSNTVFLSTPHPSAHHSWTVHIQVLIPRPKYNLLWSGPVRKHCSSQHPSDGSVLAEPHACGKRHLIDTTFGSLPETQRTVTMPPVTGSEGKPVGLLIKSLTQKNTPFHS